MSDDNYEPAAVVAAIRTHEGISELTWAEINTELRKTMHCEYEPNA